MIELDPEPDFVAFFHYGTCQFKLKNYKNAKEAYLTVLQMSPNNYWANLNSAVSYYYLEEWEQAIGHLDKIFDTALHEDLSNIFSIYGHSYGKIEDLKKSEYYWREYITLWPNSRLGHRELAEVQKRQSKYLDSLDTLRKMIDLPLASTEAYQSIIELIPFIDDIQQLESLVQQLQRIKKKSKIVDLNLSNLYSILLERLTLNNS